MTINRDRSEAVTDSIREQPPAGPTDVLAKIMWFKSWDELPIVPPEICKHPGVAVMTVGLDLKQVDGRRRIVTRATVCMLCGTDSSGGLSPLDALDAAWAEHRWHRSTAERIIELVQQHQSAAGKEP